ncbi:hypothetical protein FRP1_29380 (plasmid) [Pseudonocardia sp. EC080625-04]|uniref:class I adenylate-forming enzyme family protein n=1 Tax=unclassified Pseudonocardia TaxID=2619320 RepID=UPI0006CB0F01|nr:MULTISPECIES: AMP-binding protein [unclassified Pseudonocardia]ALE76885.1 hypothetical protein FRP1_29380 [Pseudonocardia sp. EC080625-04]ALL85829.1 hypothetical protein AD017_32255 [Pseudonocardia sp. EC080619-01]
MDLRRMVLFGAERHPDRVAMVDERGALTYEQWANRILAVAGGLAELGVGHGDRVGMGMRNSVDAATVFFATQVLGAVAAPFNFRLKPAGIAQVLTDAEAMAIVCDEGVVPDSVFSADGMSDQMLRITTGTNLAPGWTSLDDLAATGDPILRGVVTGDDLSTILYTSGTTGRPKGVAVTHRNTHARITSYIGNAGPRIDDELRALGAAPIYHTVGLHWVLCQTVYLNGSYYPLAEVDQNALLQRIRSAELTYLFGSPTLFHIMLSGRGPGFEYLSSVDHVTFGSAPMPAPVLEEMLRCFPNASINEVYGTTELSIPFLTRDCTRYPAGALRPTADQRVRIVAPGGEPSAVVAAETPGELIVDMNTEATVAGYWNAPEKLAEKVRDGWFYTGDAFRRDEAGNYFISGRLDDIIITGAENVQPAEVEQVLLEHPAITDVAVVGTPHGRWGEVVTAFIATSDPDLDEQAVDSHCRLSVLADFKRPRRLVFVDQIPRNPSGKIVRTEVRALYSTMETAAAETT